MRDKEMKGRGCSPFRDGSPKLTKADADNIRRIRSEGAPLKVIAQQYRLHPDHVRKITNGKVWA